MGCKLFIKRIQDRLKLNNDQLAKKMGVNSVTISCWRSGTYSPSVANLDRMLSYLGQTLDDCLYLPGEAPHPAELPEEKIRPIVREMIDEMTKPRKKDPPRRKGEERRTGKERRGLREA